MASPASSLVPSHERLNAGLITGNSSGAADNEDGDFQGPHKWRERLKPVRSRITNGDGDIKTDEENHVRNQNEEDKKEEEDFDSHSFNR